jgi:hypothetical protein
MRHGPVSPGRRVAVYSSEMLNGSSGAWESALTSQGYSWVGSVPGFEPGLVIAGASERLGEGELWRTKTTPCTLSRPLLEMSASERVLIGRLSEEDHETWRAAFEVLRKRLVPVLVDAPNTARAMALLSLGAQPASSPLQLIA